MGTQLMLLVLPDSSVTLVMCVLFCRAWKVRVYGGKQILISSSRGLPPCPFAAAAVTLHFIARRWPAHTLGRQSVEGEER